MKIVLNEVYVAVDFTLIFYAYMLKFSSKSMNVTINNK